MGIKLHFWYAWNWQEEELLGVISGDCFPHWYSLSCFFFLFSILLLVVYSKYSQFSFNLVLHHSTSFPLCFIGIAFWNERILFLNAIIWHLQGASALSCFTRQGGWYELSCEVDQSCPILCNPMDCILSGSSIHGIFQARVLEWVAISFSRGIFLTQGLNPGLPHCRLTLYHLSYQKSPWTKWPGIKTDSSSVLQPPHIVHSMAHDTWSGSVDHLTDRTGKSAGWVMG